METKEQAIELVRYADFFRQVKSMKNADLAVALAWESPEGKEILSDWIAGDPNRAFYPVFYGRQSAIFTNV